MSSINLGKALAKDSPATDENEPKGEESVNEAEAMAKQASGDPESQEKQADLEAAENAADAGGKHVYSSHPIAAFHVGGFQFKDGTLTIEDDKEAERFEKLVEGLPPRDKSTIRKINTEGADAIARKFNNSSTSKRGVDTTGSDAAA